MQELVIDRAVWLRGEYGHSLLFRPSDERMCCLGIYLAACGVSRRRLTNQGGPRDVPGRIPKQAMWLLKNPHHREASDLAYDLMRANDTEDVRANTREAKVRGLFKQAGVLVRFIGKSPA